MRAKLTDKSVRALTAEPGEYREVWDSQWKMRRSSFGVRVSGTTGSKSWTLTYRKGGKGQRMTIGSTPGMTLAQARDRATEIASSVVLGADPVAERNKAKAAPTFRAVAERFLREYPKLAELRPRTVADYTRGVHYYLMPRWADRKAEEITRRDVIEVLDDIRLNRGSPVQSNRTRALISILFRWALERDLVAASPATALPRRPKEKSRERVLSDAEVRVLWRELDAEAEPVRGFFRFLLATGQRSGETRLAEWSDIESGVWSIPAEHTKSGKPHRVPLSALAQSILDDIGAVTGEADYVFESPSSRGDGAIRWTYRAVERVRDRCGFDFRAHDLRRTCATGMARLGVDRLTIERAQGRSDGSVAAIYDRHLREPEVRAALELWGAHLERLISLDRKAGDDAIGVSERGR